MIPLPDQVAPELDTRSGGALLRGLTRLQWRTMIGCAATGAVWLTAQAVLPLQVGRVIDTGVVAGDRQALLTGCLQVAGLGLLIALAGLLRHRLAVSNWMQATLRTARLAGHHVADHGPAVTAVETTGEVVSVLSSDAPRIGDLFDVVGRATGAVVAGAVTAAVLVGIDPVLGWTVLIGLPLLTVSVSALVRPLSVATGRYRALEGELTALGADTVAGLRVLRGIGGEARFNARYAGRSQAVRAAGGRVAAVQSLLDAAHVLLPGVFLVALTGLAGQAALAGRISAGELVAVFGLADFLRTAIEVLTEAFGKLIRARVGAARVVALTGPRRPDRALDAHHPMPPPFAPVHDPDSGFTVSPRRLTGLLADVPGEAAALAHRLALLGPGTPPRIGGTPADALDPDAVRARILLAEAEPHLFAGTVREVLDPLRRHADAALLAAIEVADAADVLAGHQAGLDAPVEERGRSWSGGQRQRMALARAVLAAPEVLVLVDPTSAVDTHTEARIATRLAAARRGLTTVLVTTSPLLLQQCDDVVRLHAGRVRSDDEHARR